MPERYKNDYLVAFACFECRKSYKRPFEKYILVRKCPECGGAAVDLGRKFQPPKKSDIEKWKTVQFLYEHGFTYRSLEERRRYPEDLKSAREFVENFPRKKALGFAVSVKIPHPEKPKNFTHKSIFVPWEPYKNPEIPKDEV